MDRRGFLRSASVAGLGLTFANPFAKAKAGAADKPNILFIVVDEMRFPSVFPSGVDGPAEFLQAFMPNTYRLWRSGVKFGKHFTAGVACTPSRGVLATGLYPQQTWMMQTLKGTPDTKVSIPPVLDPIFPTYGKLLRKAGYQTPYVGKWHLSLVKEQIALEPYGFHHLSFPDPTGSNLQGVVGDHANGYLNDQDIAGQAANWLGARTTDEQPWCLTVCFVNPHDHMFFWAGTEFQTYNNLFDSQSTYQPSTYYSSHDGTAYPPVVTWDENVLKNPPSYGYPVTPPNWESAAQIAANKPSTQAFFRGLTEFVWGGISDDPGQEGFTITPFAAQPGYGTGVAPFSYWQRTLDSYTQTLSIVDQQIGRVLDALPEDVAAKTVIVFTSDHGDYAGAHGFPSNKGFTGYDEAWHVPLMVVDPTGRFTGDIDEIRHDLTSSIDMTPLLVSLGHNGSQDWVKGANAHFYGARHDMVPMLKSASAPGRPYVLMVSDELMMSNYNPGDAPLHLLGMRTKHEKVVTYARWKPMTGDIIPKSVEVEFYNYATEGGRAELDNTPDDPRAAPLVKKLLQDLLPNEVRASLGGKYSILQSLAKERWLLFAWLIEHPPEGKRSPKFLQKWLGIGRDA
jgi:uncharacterized sulfatase